MRTHQPRDSATMWHSNAPLDSALGARLGKASTTPCRGDGANGSPIGAPVAMRSSRGVAPWSKKTWPESSWRLETAVNWCFNDP